MKYLNQNQCSTCAKIFAQFLFNCSRKNPSTSVMSGQGRAGLGRASSISIEWSRRSIFSSIKHTEKLMTTQNSTKHRIYLSVYSKMKIAEITVRLQLLFFITYISHDQIFCPLKVCRRTFRRQEVSMTDKFVVKTIPRRA